MTTLITQRPLIHDPSALATLPLILQRIFAARGVQHPDDMNQKLDSLLPFHSLLDIEKACRRIEGAIRQQEQILIVGDFDADGATSTALAVSALRCFGAENVDFLVPNRFEYGYGLSVDLVEFAKSKNPHLKLIITVDNGICNIEGVETAQAAGIDVIVTDHHLPGETLPPAIAIVNPNQPHDPFPSKSIAGVGVIFYVMLALRRHLTNQGWFDERGEKSPNMAQFLDLVALGTVADVVALDKNNRTMVKQGIERIRQGLARPGIMALVRVAGRQYSILKASDLGYAVAPRLNAAGRLEDMSIGIACLLSDNQTQALEIAEQLDTLNQERRAIEADMRGQALQNIQDWMTLIEKGKELPVALCLMDKAWHQGVIGILAGRLKDRYHRPTIIFAEAPDGILKGSARSVSGLNIRDVLAAVDRDYPQLISKFGGHAMAAGLTLSTADFESFKQAFITEVEKHLDLSQCIGTIWTDGPLTSDDFTIETAQLLQESGPWGQQFPEPCFDNIFILLEQKIVGSNHLKLTFALPECGTILDGIFFNIEKNSWPNMQVKRARVAYRLDINRYQGKSRLQLLVEAIHPIINE